MVAHVRAVIYTRQSLDRSGDGMAVARQADACRKLCRERGWTVVETVTDNDMSASTGMTRPGFERVLGLAADRAVDVIVCWHVDRLTRRLVELERVIAVCETAKVRLATVSGDLDLSTDAGRLVGRILASVARGEVERKGARQRAAREQAAVAGRPSTWGARAFGYGPDRVSVVPAEARAIVRACRMIQAGGTLRGVVRDWTEFELAPPQGAPRWSSQSVRSVLTNPRIAGLSTYKGQVVGVGQWPAIVPEDQWRSVRALLEDASRRPPTGTQAFLSGLAVCACGEPMWSGRSYRGMRVYKCSTYINGTAVAGTHVSRSAGPVDDFVRDRVLVALAAPDARDLLVGHDRTDVDELRTELTTLTNRLDELAAAFAAGEIDRNQLRTGTTKVRTRIAEAESRLADSNRVSVLGDLVTADDVAAVWNGLDLDRQRAVVDVLMSVRLLPVGRGARTFRPDTVEITWRST